jgi:hypothetical protein
VNFGATSALSGTLLAAGVVLLTLGYIEGGSLVFAALAIWVVGAIGRGMVTESDKKWLPQVVLAGFAVKMIASFARFAVLEFVYGGGGDAQGYHGAGNRLVHDWRSFHIPSTGIGTEFVNAVTGFLYIPYVPTMLGGFLLFATLAFFGQLMLYAAFRHSTGGKRAGWYAAGVLFLPTIVYWPSSIGKESVMFLFLGAGSLGAARLLTDFRMRWMFLFSIGAVGAAAIRPHVALLLGGSWAPPLLFGKAPRKGLGRRKTVAIGLVSIVLVLVGTFAAAKFGIDFASGLAATEDLGTVLNNVEGSTSKGGSGITGTGIRSPVDFPAGFIKVMFRPFPQEANNAQALLSSMEGVFLLLLFALRFVPMMKGLRSLRRKPYMIFALVFTIGFVIGFSSFNNFGLLARERSQVVPFFIALLVGLDTAAIRDEGTSPDDTHEPTGDQTNIRNPGTGMTSRREAMATRAR